MSLRRLIPYSHQSISQQDIDSVTDVLRSKFLTQGPVGPMFEKMVAERVNATHAVAVNSATSALHISCLALGLGPGDLLWTSPNTFVASANCGLYCGAQVDFVDIDPKTYNICPISLRAKLEAAESQGRLPKIVVPVHFAGQSCDMETISALGQRFGFKIIEDASHGLGGAYRERPVGNCHYSDITIFSFHAIKLITTGEGGMALTNNSDLADKMIKLRNHGITRQEKDMLRKNPDRWYYEQRDLGFNYRMTDIAAALGVSQMQRLQAFMSRRMEIVERYNAELKRFPLVLPWQHPDTNSAWHLYVVKCENLVEKQRLVEHLHMNNISTNVHYIPVHTQPYYQSMGFKYGDFPEAESYYERALSLPIYSDLTTTEQSSVLNAVSEFFT